MTIEKKQQRAWIAEAERLQRMGQRFSVQLDVASLLILTGQVQLALRHPGNRGFSANMAEKFVRDLQNYVSSISPDLAAMMEVGWHPEHDELKLKPDKDADGKDHT